MRIAIASDHGGFQLKARLVEQLKTVGHDVKDLGTNDANAKELAGSLRELTQLAKAHQVVVATVNSPFDERAKNTLLRRYARTHPNVNLLDWHQESRQLNLPDGIHGGYTERAELLADALSPTSMDSSSCASVGGSAAGVARVDGGGRLVAIPGQAGQLIDGRIVDDVVYLIETYRITITAGYDLTGHAANGEHPLGLALDIVPGPAGSWDDIDRLARWAEPTPGSPRPPFRWVGYDGDANHGRGHHLHLSWNHGPAPGQRPPAAWVDTLDLTR
jgi:hypothetical protein